MYTIQEDGTVVTDREPEPPAPPGQHEWRYTYQYDSYGNWTEQTSTSGYAPDAPFSEGPVNRQRKLTYY